MPNLKQNFSLIFLRVFFVHKLHFFSQKLQFLTPTSHFPHYPNLEVGYRPTMPPMCAPAQESPFMGMPGLP